MQSATNSEIIASPQPPDFSQFLNDGLSLYPFQARMIEKNLNSPSPIIYNGSSPGVGKTVEALTYANVRLSYLQPTERTLLIVAPAALVPLWVDEANKWLQRGTRFVVVSYTKLVVNQSLYNELKSFKWAGIIFDEAHKCRTMTAKTTFASIALWRSAFEFIYLASGTPIEYAGTDLFPVLAATSTYLPYLSDKTRMLCSDYDKFGMTFSYPLPNQMSKGDERRFKDVRNAPELQEMIYNEFKFFFRDLRENVLTELPEVSSTVVPITLKRTQTMDVARLDELMNYQAFYDLGAIDAHVATLRRLLGIAKATNTEFLDFAEEILSQGEPLVIMAYHVEVLEFLRQHFQRHNPVVRSGAVSAMQKHLDYKAFQEGKSQLFLGQIAASGEGISLTRSCNLIMLEWDWFPSKVFQAISRLIRVTQMRKPNIYFISSNNNFDTAMMKNLKQLDVNIAKVLD